MTIASSSPFRPILAALALSLSGAVPGNDADPVLIHIEWIDHTPDNGILVSDILVAAHDGELDLLDHEQPVPEQLADIFGALATRGIGAALQAVNATGLDAVVHGMHNYPLPSGGIGTPRPGTPLRRNTTLRVQPDVHRYLSYLAAINPGNDALIGNDEPTQVELFDAEGRFRGPLVIDLFGSQAIDAGLCDNDEADLRFLDNLTMDACAGGEGMVRPHPGLNGSLRNPDGEPQRVLGGRFVTQAGILEYDATAADFTVPGYRLGRLLITRPGVQKWHLAGSWYNPDRAGEGFNLEVVEPAAIGRPSRILVYWYTFEPDDSGSQVWLTGMAELGANATRVPLHRAEGGRFASTDNPDLVQREPWGHVDLHFASCFEGLVQYAPLDPAWPEGAYSIHRLGPLPEGVGPLCQRQ